MSIARVESASGVSSEPVRGVTQLGARVLAACVPPYLGEQLQQAAALADSRLRAARDFVGGRGDRHDRQRKPAPSSVRASRVCCQVEQLSVVRPADSLNRVGEEPVQAEDAVEGEEGADQEDEGANPQRAPVDVEVSFRQAAAGKTGRRDAQTDRQ